MNSIKKQSNNGTQISELYGIWADVARGIGFVERGIAGIQKYLAQQMPTDTYECIEKHTEAYERVQIHTDA